MATSLCLVDRCRHRRVLAGCDVRAGPARDEQRFVEVLGRSFGPLNLQKYQKKLKLTKTITKKIFSLAGGFG